MCVRRATLNNPRDAWIKRAPFLDSQLAIPIVRDMFSHASWKDDDTFEHISKVLLSLEKAVPSFFERFDYNWIFDKSSYDFPQESFFQLLAIDAVLAIWTNTPENKLNRKEFGGLCPRYRLNWDLQESSPRIIPQNSKNDTFRFIAVPYAWFEISALSIDALLVTNPISFSIDTSKYLTDKHDTKAMYRLWDAIIIRGICGSLECHELLLPLFIDRISLEFNAQLNATSYSEINSSLNMQEFSQRYTIAHEVGHFLDPIFRDEALDMDEELMADQFAMQALSIKQWEANRYRYKPLISDATYVPHIGGIGFYFILLIYEYTNYAVSLAMDIPMTSENHEERMLAINSRISNWKRYIYNEEAKNMHQDKHSASEGTFVKIIDFFDYAEKHGHQYSQYCIQRTSEMFDKASQIAEDLKKAYPILYDPDATDAYIRNKLDSNPVVAMQKLRKQFEDNDGSH